MAMQKGTNLLAKLAPTLQKTFDENKTKEVEMGRQNLPGGIRGGIAQLVDMKLDVVKPGKQNAGSIYFYAAGVVHSPNDVNGIPVKGLRTSIMEPLYNTPERSRKTPADHLKWIMNELKKLGANLNDLKQVSNIETVIIPALLKAKPFFRFSTEEGEVQKTGPYKDKPARIFENWNGMIADYVPGQEGDEVVDESEHAEPQEGEAQTEETTEQAEEVDVDALLATAQDDDAPDQADAQTKLRELAEAAGATTEWLDSDTVGWEDIAEVVRTGTAPEAQDEAQDEPQEAEGPAWTKGDVALYQPIDPKTKKPMINAKTKKAVKVECEITALDPKKSTATLKNLDDPKLVYKDISLDKLEVPS